MVWEYPSSQKDKEQIHKYFDINLSVVLLRLHIKRKKDRSLLQFDDHVKPLIEKMFECLNVCIDKF